MFQSSKGLWRTIGATLSAIGGIVFVVPIPQVQVWSGVILALGSVIGGLGVARAVAAGTLTDMKANQ